MVVGFRGILMEVIFKILEYVSSNENPSMVICLGIAIALGWGWWRREIMHVARYDKIRSEYIKRIDERDEKLESLGRQAYETMTEIASALSAMERTLECLDAMSHHIIDRKIKND
jgi:hypothetical protein